MRASPRNARTAGSAACACAASASAPCWRTTAPSPPRSPPTKPRKETRRPKPNTTHTTRTTSTTKTGTTLSIFTSRSCRANLHRRRTTTYTRASRAPSGSRSAITCDAAPHPIWPRRVHAPPSQSLRQARRWRPDGTDRGVLATGPAHEGVLRRPGDARPARRRGDLPRGAAAPPAGRAAADRDREIAGVAEGRAAQGDPAETGGEAVATEGGHAAPAAHPAARRDSRPHAPRPAGAGRAGTGDAPRTVPRRTRAGGAVAALTAEGRGIRRAEQRRGVFAQPQARLPPDRPAARLARRHAAGGACQRTGQTALGEHQKEQRLRGAGRHREGHGAEQLPLRAGLP